MLRLKRSGQRESGSRARGTRKRLLKWSALGLGSMCLGVLAVVLTTPTLHSVHRIWRWSNTAVEHGTTFVQTGDRLVDVEFARSFPSPPNVTATPQQLAGQTSFAIVRADEQGFRLELAAPAATDVSFSWVAFLDRWSEAEHVTEEVGLPSILTARINNGQPFRFRVEAYEEDRPTALLIETRELDKLDSADAEIVDAALRATRDAFNRLFTCDWRQRLRRLLRFRMLPCPAVGKDRERKKWERVDSDQWSMARGSRGLEVIRKDDNRTPVEMADVVMRWTDLVSTSEALDLLSHNNQVLDFMDTLTFEGVLNPQRKLTVIHFDTHSDIWIYRDAALYASSEHIGDFFNKAIAQGRVEEIYWVLPDWTRQEPYVETYWADQLPSDPTDLPTAYVEGPRTLEIFVDHNTDALHFGSPPARLPEDMETVRYHKVLLSELPDFTGQDDVYLEVDGDYFSNTGFDTELKGVTNPDRQGMLTAIESAAQVLIERGVKPRFTSWCLSPSYTAPEDELDQEFFFLSVLDRLQATDYLLAYAHSEESGRLPRARNVTRQSALDHLLLALRYQDFVQLDGDRHIDMINGQDESQVAQQLIEQKLGLGPDQSLTLLRRLDRFDGQLDGIVNLNDVEYFSGVADVNQLLLQKFPLGQNESHQ